MVQNYQNSSDSALADNAVKEEENKQWEPNTKLEFGLQKLADVSISLARDRIGAIILSFGILFLFVSVAFSATTWVIAYNADNIIKIITSVKK